MPATIIAKVAVLPAPRQPFPGDLLIGNVSGRIYYFVSHAKYGSANMLNEFNVYVEDCSLSQYRIAPAGTTFTITQQ